MSSKRFSLTVVGFGALAASLMVLPGVLDASSNEVRPVPMGVGMDGTKECEDAGITGTTGVKVEGPFTDGEVIVVPVDGGTVTFTFSNPNDDGEAETVTVTFSGVTGVAIVGKAGQAVEVDSTAPFELTFEQGISNVAACFIPGTTTSTTAPSTTSTAPTTSTTIPASTTTTAASTTTTASSSTTSSSSTVPETTTTIPVTSTTTPESTTTTTGDSTTTTTGDSTTTTTGGSTTTTGDSTTTTTGGSTTTTGGSSTTTGGSSTVGPPPSTMPNTGAGDSSNLIGAALLSLMAGALALLFARRQAA